MTIDVSETPGSPVEVPKRSRLRWLIGVAIVVLLAVLAGGWIAAQGDDNPNGAGTSTGAQQLASIQQACTQWHDGSTGGSASPSAWCDEMVGWMTTQVNGRQMVGSTMWANPDQMLATCQQWMATRQPTDSTPDAAAWCGQMVGWMTEHMGSWDQWDRGWMMDGPMMGP